MGGIEVKPLSVTRPVGSPVIGAGEGGDKTRLPSGDFDDENLVKLLGDRLIGNVMAVRGPARISRHSMNGGQLRAIGPIDVARPNIGISQAVGFEDDFFPSGEKSGRRMKPRFEKSRAGGPRECLGSLSVRRQSLSE